MLLLRAPGPRLSTVRTQEAALPDSGAGLQSLPHKGHTVGRRSDTERWGQVQRRRLYIPVFPVLTLDKPSASLCVFVSVNSQFDSSQTLPNTPKQTVSQPDAAANGLS